MHKERQCHDQYQAPQQIQPGLCPPEGCPPFDRIECIVVDKVYDSCFQIEDLSRDFTVRGSAEIGDPRDCSLKGEISSQVIDRVDAGNGFFTINLLITVPLKISNPVTGAKIVRKIRFTKTVTLCCPEGVCPDVSESTLMSCNCVVTEVDGSNVTAVDGSNVTISCDLQVCLVIKCILKVQLLVPSYGFCVPAPCITLPGVCPPLPPEQCF